MRISDWSSDVCSSDLSNGGPTALRPCTSPGSIDHEHRSPQYTKTVRRLHRPGQCVLEVSRRQADGPAGPFGLRQTNLDRTSVVSGKSVSVRVDQGGRRVMKKKKAKRK